MDSLLLASAKAGSAEPETLDAVRDVLAEDGAVAVALTSTKAELDAALDVRGGRRLVLAGGDGSLHLLAQRLRKRGELADIPVGLVPMGTGNDLARHLKLPLEPVAAARTVLAGEPRRLDLLRSDGGGGVVVNAVHLGKGAEAAERASDLKRGLGKLAYPIGAAAALLRPKGWRLHVNVDDEVLSDGEHRVVMVAIGNGSSIGGGTQIFPDADASDGALDVFVLGPGGGATGTAGQPFRLMRRGRGRAVTVTPAPGVTVGVNADGELSELNRRRSWWVDPSAWSVICRPAYAG